MTLQLQKCCYCLQATTTTPFGLHCIHECMQTRCPTTMQMTYVATTYLYAQQGIIWLMLSFTDRRQVMQRVGVLITLQVFIQRLQTDKQGTRNLTKNEQNSNHTSTSLKRKLWYYHNVTMGTSPSTSGTTMLYSNLVAWIDMMWWFQVAITRHKSTA